jgi:hypothetical protein
MTAFATAAQRWAGIGPYYAMFPIPFSDAVIEAFTEPGDLVLDPFAGRASSIFSAATRARPAIGVEINPVGWVYGNAKLFPARHRNVERRLTEISDLASAISSGDIRRLPPFFTHCFHSDVLDFLLAARANLRWRSSSVDRTLMAFILVYLHGKQGQALSNQMRQSKAMSPQYSIRWWHRHGMMPPKTNPVDFLRPRIAWRYAKGLPAVSRATLALGDSCNLLRRLTKSGRPAKLLFTSPPYLGITNYYYDQWLRLWMLGGPELPRGTGETHKGKFGSHANYRALLSRVFTTCSDVMDDAGYVYVRTDARPHTLALTREILEATFPNWAITATERPFARPTQTALFGDKSNKPGEIDLVLCGPRARNRDHTLL